MKQAVICALLMLISYRSPAQFEGALDMKTTLTPAGGEARQVAYTLMVKGDKVVADVRQVGGVDNVGKIIYRGDRNLTWVIDDAHKSYLEIDLKPEQEGEQEETAGGSSSGLKLRKTGKTQRILGYACSEWIVEDSDVATSFWGTSKLGDIYEGLHKTFGQLERRSPRSSSAFGWESELAKLKVFPLKIVTSKGGSVVETQEVTKIEPKTLSASLFEVPEDYKKQDMGPSMEQMMEALKKYHGKNGGEAGEMKQEDIEKMLKELQEKMKKGGGEPPDSLRQNNR